LKRSKRGSSVLGLTILTAILAIPQAALGGPPLTCHPFDIGGAKSLPWTADILNLQGSSDYDISRLADDTLALLQPGTPVIVRMETLRRAALYSRRDPLVAMDLLTKLKSRATGSEALARFDAGYFAETLRQADMTFKKNPNGSWDPVYAANAATGFAGYAWVQKAIELRGQDPDMEFAAALITSYPRQKSYDEHLRKAVSGAALGSLLAKNLVLHFGERGTTIADLRAKVATASR
jgi:hypothetical protein